jgi:hypothetical protein
MTSQFFSLGWKKFFRSAYWKKSLLANILMGLLALYFIACFLIIGIAVYPGLAKAFPESNPFILVNEYILFFLMIDLVLRYFMQKIPVMDVKPLLLQNIKKTRIVRYILNKSIFSYFNLLPLFFLIPFTIFTAIKGEEGWGVFAWFIGIMALVLINNFINYLAEKNNFFFGIVLSVLVLFSINRYYGFYNFDSSWGGYFSSLAYNPITVLIPLSALIILYNLSKKVVLNALYLDQGLSQKAKVVESSDLSFVNALGSVAPFIKNDMRLIWRNKRPRSLFLMSFLFGFYGIIFFSQDTYADMPAVLMFAALFTTGGFAINFGQFIPAWDASYYQLLMTQRTSYKDYLNSKYILMICATAIMLVLTTPYYFMGWEIYGLVIVGAIYNMGINTLVLLFAGAYIKKPIDLDGPAMGNMQGSSANQFIIIIPLLGIPAGLVYLVNYLSDFNTAIAIIGGLGVLGLLLKQYAFRYLNQLYSRRKYQTLQAFNQ